MSWKGSKVSGETNENDKEKEKGKTPSVQKQGTECRGAHCSLQALMSSHLIQHVKEGGGDQLQEDAKNQSSL